MQLVLSRGNENVGHVLFNEETGAVTTDIADPNDQAQVESVIAAALPSGMVGRVDIGKMDEITQDRTWFDREIVHKLEAVGFTCQTTD